MFDVDEILKIGYEEEGYEYGECECGRKMVKLYNVGGYDGFDGCDWYVCGVCCDNFIDGDEWVFVNKVEGLLE